MRLTLRTLLAHLDNALEAEDNAAIAAKLRESEFASNLVKRILASVASDRIGAASPLASGTADDANRVGEYLDSVLSSEQVAEIERICLESENHLAEVASCHQILTIVLGNPAEIPPALRTRIYELGLGRTSAEPSVGVTNGNMAGTVRRVASSSHATSGNDALTQAIAASQTMPTNATLRTQTIQPVGPDDSGVSDAPTRLRERANAKSASERNKPINPDSRRMDAAEASAVFGRPSRVVPWLVSLALAASFLFVAVQAFAPLLRKKSLVDDDKMTLATAAPLPAEAEDHAAVSPADMISKTVPEVEASEVPPMVDLNPSSGLAESSVVPDTPTPESQANDGTPDIAEMMELPVPVAEPIVAVEPTVTDATPMVPAIEDAPPPANAVIPTKINAPVKDAAPPANVIGVSDVPVGTTTITSDGTLVLVRKPNTPSFVMAKKDDPIPSNSEVICPPLYRDRLSISGSIDLTMVGPSKILIDTTIAALPAFTVINGRLLMMPIAAGDAKPAIDATQAGGAGIKANTVTIVFDGVSHELTFTEPDAVAAIEIIPLRNPGTGPEENRATTKFIEVLSVQGTLAWKTDGADSMSIATGEILRWSSTVAVAKSVSTSIPAWIDSPKPAPSSIETSARDGMLALVRANEAIELSLREAIDFRRAEVGALAAQTLLLLDRPDVYFGADGIFADVKQKAFWPEHFNALVATIDRGPESAAVVRGAISQMDFAEATAIYRLLWLFSNAQLEAGSDERLVASLDSPNMTVRVLTTENLRRITGTTLFYKPENDTAPRRSSDIKKWETRLRKGDIRWVVAGAPDAK